MISKLQLYLETFIALVFGFLLLGISIQLFQLIGAFVIGVSISLQTKSKHKKIDTSTWVEYLFFKSKLYNNEKAITLAEFPQ